MYVCPHTLAAPAFPQFTRVYVCVYVCLCVCVYLCVYVLTCRRMLSHGYAALVVGIANKP